jgi:ribonuclease VapC
VIVDSSAFVAIALREPGYEALVEMVTQPAAAVSAVSALEVRIVLGSKRVGLSAAAVNAFLERTGIDVVEFTAAHSEAAAVAYRRFGRGNHAARLNFGDCASYATAQLAGQPLLFVGDDFTKTDVEPALAR